MDTGATSQLPMWLMKVGRAFLVTDEHQIRFIQYNAVDMFHLSPTQRGLMKSSHGL